jgi:outer membrane protein assembly factor BamB
MKVIISIYFYLFLTISLAYSQAPTLWRGPHNNGNYDETGLLKSWPASGPEIAWKYEQLGLGYSSPVVAGNKIYISGTDGNTGFIYVLSTEGKLLWKAPYGEEFVESYPGSRSTPTIVGDLMYQCSGLGGVTCMDAANGTVRWKKDMAKEYGGKAPQWAYNESFAIDGDKIFITPGGPGHTIVALNRLTGAEIWSANVKNDISAYCSPLIVKIPGRTLLVTHIASDIVGVDANTGKVLWTYPHPNQWSVQANTPIYFDGALFCFSGYGQGGVKLKLSPDGSSVSPEWTTKFLDNRIGGAVLVNGYLYGSGDNNRFWMCLDWKTGEMKYKAPGLANGTVISADGMLYGYTEKGELFLAKADPTTWKVISQSKVTLGTTQHWAHPVISGGNLLIRRGSALMAYRIK